MKRIIILLLFMFLTACGSVQSVDPTVPNVPNVPPADPPAVVVDTGDVSWTIEHIGFNQVRLTAYFPLGTTGDAVFSATPIDGVCSPSVVPIASGMASTTLTGATNGIYRVTVTAIGGGLFKTTAKTVASGGSSIVGSVTVSTAQYAWQSILPGGGWTIPLAIAATASGGYATYSTISGSISQSYLRKFDAAGNVLWTVAIPIGADNLQTSNTNLLATDGTNAYVGVRDLQGAGLLYKFAPDGNQVWATTEPHIVMVRYSPSDGHIIVVNEGTPMHVSALDTAGNQVWDVTSGLKTVTDMSVTSAIYLAGVDTSIQGFLQRLDLSAGGTIWSQTASGPGGASVTATAEGVYYAGVNNTQNVWQKFDLNGNLVWDHSTVKPSGSLPLLVSIYGTNAGIFANTTSGVQKYDFDGNLIWTVPGSWGFDLGLYGQQVYYIRNGASPEIGRIDDIY